MTGASWGQGTEQDLTVQSTPGSSSTTIHLPAQYQAEKWLNADGSRRTTPLTYPQWQFLNLLKGKPTAMPTSSGAFALAVPAWLATPPSWVLPALGGWAFGQLQGLSSEHREMMGRMGPPRRIPAAPRTLRTPHGAAPTPAGIRLGTRAEVLRPRPPQAAGSFLPWPA